MNYCVLCHRNIRRKRPLCPACENKQNRYRVSDLKLNYSKKPCTCSFDLENRDHLFYYRGDLLRLIQMYKFEGIKTLSLWFANCINEFFKNKRKPDYLQLIPPGKFKLYKKGWDQMSEIGKHLDIPQIYCLEKIGRISQKSLNKEQRWKNRLALFRLSQTPPPKGNILLLDDIETTGATLMEAARLLKSAGAEKVSTLTIAID